MERRQKLKVPDNRTIDVGDEYAVNYWMKELGVSERRLKAAVNIAGNSAVEVKRELNK